MTLEQLRIFVAVAEQLHMTRAAETLGVTQSAASAAVAALEARHGAQLFDRVGRGLALSPAGAVFLPEAKAVLLAARQAEQALEDLAGLTRGPLQIAASQTVASYWLPSHLARFAAAHPGVTLTLMVGNTQGVADWVSEGAADLGFVEGVVARPELATTPVGSDRIALLAAPFHPLAGQTLEPSDLTAVPWVLREVGSGTRATFDEVLLGHGLTAKALRVVLELPSNEAALAAVADGALVTAVSELAARPLMDSGRLVRLGFDLAARDFSLLTHRSRRRGPAAAAFLKDL